MVGARLRRWDHRLLPEPGQGGGGLDHAHPVGARPDPEGARLDDQQLARRCHAAHALFLGEPRGQPLMVNIVRHPQAIPQYSRGHSRRVAVARQVQARHPGLFLAGSHLDGPGVRDCARTATAVAGQVRRWLSTGETDPGVAV